ncbi:MAG: NAD(P)H-quinone oxidoreductase [Kiritimatiellae bacterium]|nr:NAD(P)H-quinone oxidoreductase [Kiritimatiellia bacterium]
MKAMCLENREFVWKDVAEPVRRGEFNVIMDVKACAVNRADLLQRAGLYAPPPEWPEWPGLECAGVVLEAPDGGRFKPGDAVCALLGGGGYAERAAVPEGMCMPVPRGFSFEEAACLPEVYATAYLNLRTVADLKPGETLFVQAGASGLGIAAIQLAKHVFKARVVTSVGSDEKAVRVRAFGADVAINRRRDDLLSMLDRNPPDVALDPVGGPLAGPAFAKMNRFGRWVMLASLAGAETTIDLNTVWRKGLRLVGSTLRSRSVAEKTGILRAMEAEVWPLMEKREIAPVIHKVLPIAEAGEAHRILAANENIGKVVMTA